MGPQISGRRIKVSGAREKREMEIEHNDMQSHIMIECW